MLGGIKIIGVEECISPNGYGLLNGLENSHDMCRPDERGVFRKHYCAELSLVPNAGIDYGFILPTTTALI